MLSPAEVSFLMSFIRRYWYYDSVKQICARFGFSKSKVTVTLMRTREKLAKYLKKEGYLL